MHCDKPVRFDDGFPFLRQNDFTLWAKKIIAAFLDMWSEALNMQEILPDKPFHSLQRVK
jgi:hypothetical protein